MIIIESFENFNKEEDLIIVDVQKSFRKFFSEMYLNELKKYCKGFKNVYNLFDNHVDGENIDKDYLYDQSPDVILHDDIYYFPNQRDIIEKRYNYNVNVSFYKSILDKSIYDDIKLREDNKKLKKGEIFKTKKGTHIVYVGNKHIWFHIGKKMYRLFESKIGKKVYIVGGSDSECLEDVYVAAETIGVKIKRNWRFIYSSAHCSIQ